MNLQIVSDLHIDSESRDSYDELIKPTGDILILNGDIGSLYNPTELQNFLEVICKKFKLVLYVYGNHEFYYYKKYGLPQPMYKLKKTGQRIADKIKNLHILDKSSVLVNGVCIAGCTLWSNIQKSLPKYIVKISDVNTNQYKFMHEQDLKYINHMIEYCQQHGHKLILATHYPPSSQCIPSYKKLRKDLYCNNLDYLLSENNVKVWFFGHIHTNYDFVTSGGTRVVGNQLGKQTDNVQDFSNEKIVCV